MDNWQTAYRQLQAMEGIDLMVVGGDLTRDGHLHDFEMEMAKRELDALPFPYYAIPGNIEAGNKWTDKNGGTGRKDPDLNMKGEMLDRFATYFGESPWSFIHKNVRFSGVYAAVAGSGPRLWPRRRVGGDHSGPSVRDLRRGLCGNTAVPSGRLPRLAIEQSLTNCQVADVK